MDTNNFREEAHRLVDWMADYLENLADRPVKPATQPGEVLSALPGVPPDLGENFSSIFADFENLIVPNMTHWQSPRFFAYFPANSSYPSLLAEMLTATLGAQCMMWETSPAAAELEECVMDWLRSMLALPNDWQGVIQDTASTATLTALLTARERATNYGINEQGFKGQRLRVYCSAEAHSSIEKAAKIAGIGRENVVKISVDAELRLRPELLEAAIQKDIAQGYAPLCVVAALGTTGTTAIDPLGPIADICEKHHIWLHVDAAYAGTALLLPEYRWMANGLEKADSFVTNPHKWMFTNFDCSAYFVKDATVLKRTFSILPEYLKTATQGKVNDYRDWGIQLGRRFRALKLWFVIRSFGVEGLRAKIREHIRMAHWLATEVVQTKGFEIVSPTLFNLVCFRYLPSSGLSLEAANALNETLLRRINQTGKAYLSHTKVADRYALRMVIGQTNSSESHVRESWELIKMQASSLVPT